MLDRVKEKNNQGTAGRIFAFFLLYAIVYGSIWAATEPLNLDITSSNKPLWRLLLIVGTLILTLILYFFHTLFKRLRTIWIAL